MDGGNMDTRDSRLVRARSDTVQEIAARDQKATDLVTNCPGLLEATVQLEGVDRTIPVCGKVVMQAEIAPPQV
jgi:hypothetical protein